MDAPTSLTRERPTFFAIIPAFVRYADITANAKLMYGELTALCEKEGYCWASNAYFGKLYSADERTIRRWLKELVVSGFVTVDLAANQHGQRRVFIVEARTILTGQGGQKCPGEADKNVRHSNTSIITTDNNPPTPKGEPEGFEEIWKAVWKRGGGSQPRQPAARAYAAAIKSGAKHEVIIAAVKARIGVDKPDTVYAPMLSTWLNQRRWENEGAEPVMSAADLDAANRRLEERQKKHREQMAKLTEQRSNQLLGRVS